MSCSISNQRILCFAADELSCPFPCKHFLQVWNNAVKRQLFSRENSRSDSVRDLGDESSLGGSTHRDISRRCFVRSAAVGLAGGAMASLYASEDDSASDGWIDAHSHIWTPDTDAYPLANGKTIADLAPASFTVDELLRTSRPHGVSRVVLIQHQHYYGWDNSYMTDAAAAQPDVFRVVGMVDDAKPNPEAAMRELHRKHVTGFRITPRIRGADKWLAGPGMNGMWKCAAETRQAMCCLINPEDLEPVDQMCRKYPDTPVVIDHLGRVGIDGEIREEDLRRLCGLARYPHTYVKVSAFYALGGKTPPYLDLVPVIRRVYDSFGPERLMWASDCPYQLGGANSYQASIELVRDRLDFLTDPDRNWMLRDTAHKVFFAGKA